MINAGETWGKATLDVLTGIDVVPRGV